MATPPVTPFSDLEAYEKSLSGDPQTLIDAAVAAIRSYCRWHVAPRVIEEIVLDGPGGVDLYVPTLRLMDIVSIDNAGVDIPVDTVDFSRDGIVELHRGAWSNRLGKIKLTVDHGYDDAHELTQLANTIAARAAVSPNGVTGEANDGVSIQFSKFGGQASGGVALFEHEYKLLARYRLGGQ